MKKKMQGAKPKGKAKAKQNQPLKAKKTVEEKEAEVDNFLDALEVEDNLEVDHVGEELEIEDDDDNHDSFVQALASVEGKPRFLHSNNVANLNVPLSQLLGKEKINLDEVMPKGSSKSVNKALNKMIEPKKKRRKDAKVEEEDTESKTKKSKMDLIMPAPLTTTEAARVERKAIYSKVTEDMNRWNPVVHTNRHAATKHYPLQVMDTREISAKERTKTFKARNALEEQVMALLNASKSTVPTDKELSEREEEALAKMTLQEAMEKRKELMRIRALQSYHEVKAKRQKKIKSKTYRKLTRKMKEKNRMAELEELERTNPELAAQEMEKLNKGRILERATLRHRNSSKYLQTLAKRASKDKTAQKAINEGVKHHRELTNKAIDDEDRDQVEPDDEVEEQEMEEVASEDDQDVDDEPVAVEDDTAKPLELRSDSAKSRPRKAVDPDKFIKVTKDALPTLTEVIPDEDDDNELEDDDQMMAIAEAFADDDVGTDFAMEKAQMMSEKEKGTKVDLTLPGWGSWGGQNIQVSKRKKQKFTKYVKPQAPEPAVAKKDHVIISSKDSEALARHQVSSVPFPFTSVKDFEASLRTPVGDTFVPRTVFKKMTTPKVTTQMGAPIEPMDKSELVKKDL